MLKFLPNGVLVSGDDEGEIKVWDLRTNVCVLNYYEQSETITDFAINSDLSFLLATSVDGTLGVFDLRKGDTSKEKLYALSDCMEEDLLSVAIVKNGKFVQEKKMWGMKIKKVVAGTKSAYRHFNKLWNRELSHCTNDFTMNLFFQNGVRNYQRKLSQNNKLGNRSK